MDSERRSHRLEGSDRREVQAVLDALRDGIGAEAIGLFDDNRGSAEGSAPPSFWDAFAGLACVNVDWPTWYPHLRSHGQVETPCACGAGHRLLGYLVHDRWALLLVASGSRAQGAAATSSALAILSSMLPPGHKRPPGAGPNDVASDELSAPPHMGGPIFWVRKAKG